MNHEWKPIAGYEGLYIVSETGVVKSLDKQWVTGRGKGRPHTQTGRVLKPFVSKFGYARVSLWKNGASRKFHIHAIVAKAFYPNPENKSQVNHKDGNKMNNIATNLEWATPSENMKHAYAIGIRSISEANRIAVRARSSGRRNNNARKVIDDRTGKVFDTIREAAEANGVKPHNLYVYLRGINKNITTLRYA